MRRTYYSFKRAHTMDTQVELMICAGMVRSAMANTLNKQCQLINGLVSLYIYKTNTLKTAEKHDKHYCTRAILHSLLVKLKTYK